VIRLSENGATTPVVDGLEFIARAKADSPSLLKTEELIEPE
jgi:hypothetical protein